MSGSTASRRALPRLPELALRFAVVGAVMLVLGALFATALVKPVVPLLARTVQAFTSDFIIIDAALDQGGIQPYVAFRANLAHVVDAGDGSAYPLGYGTMPPGWFGIRLTTGGIVQHALLLLIVILAWPGGARELLLRLAFALPFALLLSLQHVVVTVLAELWFPIHDHLAPREFWPLLAWSRLLMGGGGLVLALALGALVIALAARLARPRALEQEAARESLHSEPA